MWVKPSENYKPVRGDILKARLFDTEQVFKVEVTHVCGEGVWYVYEDWSYRDDFKVDISIIEGVLIDEGFYDRRIDAEQKKIDVAMKKIVDLKAEKARVVDIERI